MLASGKKKRLKGETAKSRQTVVCLNNSCAVQRLSVSHRVSTLMMN